MDSTNEMLKILIDEKTLEIIELTKEIPRSTKEIAQLMNVKNSNLYYPIKKLLEINALKVVDEKQVKNITQYYYSSAHLVSGEGLVVEGDSFKENVTNIINHYMLIQTKVIKALENDATHLQGSSDLGTAQVSMSNIHISPEKWKELSSEIMTLIKSYDEGESSENPSFQYILSSYKEV